MTDWIDIKEKSPNEGQEVLVLTEEGVQSEMVYLNDYEGFDPYAEPMGQMVTHWKPDCHG